MKQYLLTIQYDGTDFVGWQRQSLAHARNRSVQQTVEQGLEKLLRQEIHLRGAGRTDAGVHAFGQRAAFLAESGIPTANIPRALNGTLPEDVRITACQEVPLTFHPRYDAVGKVYEYYLLPGAVHSAFDRSRFFACGYELDTAFMAELAPLFEGRQNLRSFTANGTPVADYERDIYHCRLTPFRAEVSLPWRRSGIFWRLSVCGSGFLYKTVRLLMGALLEAGKRKLDAADIIRALAEPGAIIAPPAPARGLYLRQVFYAEETLQKWLAEEKSCRKQEKPIDTAE